MQKYYEILDVKYWLDQRSHNPKKNIDDSRSILTVIMQIALGLLFWRLSERPGIEHRALINLLGWIFALWSLYTALINGFFIKQDTNYGTN